MAEMMVIYIDASRISQREKDRIVCTLNKTSYGSFCELPVFRRTRVLVVVRVEIPEKRSVRCIGLDWDFYFVEDCVNELDDNSSLLCIVLRWVRLVCVCDTQQQANHYSSVKDSRSCA